VRPLDQSWDGRTYGEITSLQALGKADIPGDPELPLSRRLELRWGDTVVAKPIEWLWPGWLARGVLAVLDGNPGLGKSLLALDLVARVTTGASFPQAGRPNGPRSGPSWWRWRTPSTAWSRRGWRQRGGHSPRRVPRWRGGTDGVRDGEVQPAAAARPGPVAKAVREYQPALLVIDPLFAVMGWTDAAVSSRPTTTRACAS